MTEESIVREYSVGKFRGTFPDVEIEASVAEGIKELDANPFYAVLPIVPEVGAISSNGVLYDEELVSSIAQQINENKPGGIFGHLKDEERNTSYPLPSGTWVAAKREGNTLWGKVFLPNGPAKEHIRTLKAVGGEIATSIYGKGKFERVRDGVRRLTNFKLESLDFAPPARAALGNGAIPHVTAEMNTEQEPIMADKAQVIAELTVSDIAGIPAAVRDAIVAEASKQDETQATIAELTATSAAKDDRITVLETTVAEYQRRDFARVVDEKVAEMTAWAVSDTDKDANGKTSKDKLAALRAMFRRAILEKVGSETKTEAIAEMAAAAWEELKPIAEMLRDALTGPAAVVAARPQGYGGRKVEPPTEQEQRAAMNRMGITV
jgi:hypothetical protein